ncbi:MAG TPA: GNAT family N-acetyltransferase [Solirubrobacteraceae bacterium]|nr:GNAT family N-acetyltransferase [Solirubrobacteraceae bacterium]
MIDVRDVAAADEAAWRALWDGYLEFYGRALDPSVTAATWSRLLEPGPMSGLVAVDGDRVVGLANYLLHPSTWSRADSCYLEDLFVAPATRGRGAGRALIEALAARARERGWRHVYWHTEGGNRAARALYDGFASADGFVRYMLAP